jgi:hypothetical protein
MAREELKWQNIDADDLPAEVKKSFDAMVEAEAAFKADLEKLLKNEGYMPGQVPGYEPQGKTSWGRVCRRATRRRSVPEIQNQMSGSKSQFIPPEVRAAE